MFSRGLGAAGKAVRAATPRLRNSFDRLFPLALWAPVALAAAYLLALFALLPRLLEGHYNWRPDFVWAPLLARDLAEIGGGGLINVGETPHYSTIWFLLWTGRLPLNRVIWDFAPLVITVAGVGLMAWAARRLAGNWAGLLTLALGIAAGREILSTTLTEGMRSHTWFAIGATAALLVYLTTRPEDAGVRPLVVAGALAGVFGAVTTASDPLFAVSGLTPLAGAGTLGWLLFRSRRTRDLALVAWGATAVAVVGALIIESTMQSIGYRKTLLPAYNFVTLEEFLGALKKLLLDVLTLSNGNFFGQPVGSRSIAALGVAVLTLGALALPPILLGRKLRGARAELDEAWMLYLAFWILVQAATVAAYVLSPIPSAFGQSLTTRYLVPVYYGIAATVPLWAGTSNWRRAIVAGGTAVICLLSLFGLRDHLNEPKQPIQAQAGAIASFLQEEGLERGYAGYRIAHSFTYSTDVQLQAYPVYNCESPEPDLCPFYVNTRSVWYRPADAERTFLIVDPPDYLSILPPPPGVFGEPAQVRQFGGFSVLIYDYDIASRFKGGRAGT